MNRMSSALSAVVPALLLATASIATVAAQTRPGDAEPVPDGPPALPPRVESGATLEPEVLTIEQAHRTITEYRVNGHLRAIRIDPDGFPAYWLIDTDGDGHIDTDGTARLNGRAGGLDAAGELRPYWKVFSW